MKVMFFTLLLGLATPLFSAFAGSSSANQLQVMDDGILALNQRLELIKKAKKSIEVEYFIYSIDPVGRIFTQALLDKAREGVKVRVLVDKSAPVFELKPFYVLGMKNSLPEDKRENIEVKYFNPTMILQFYSTQFRNHRKLLVIDDEFAVTGGRNIADEYFDLNPEYNFLDRDVLLTGPLAKEMRETFDLFWDAKYAKDAKLPKEPKLSDFHCNHADRSCNGATKKQKFRMAMRRYEKNLNKGLDYVTPNADDAVLLDGIQREGERLNKGSQEVTCNETYFYTDTPGKKSRNQLLKNEIAKLIAETNEKIVVESPYFVLYSKTHNEMTELLDKKVKLTVLTNSLYSTDAVYVAAVFNAMAATYVQEGMQAYIYRGKSPIEWGGVSEEAHEGIWGIHSKSATFDDKHTFIGTYNVDPRSRNLNFEMGIVCKNNPELAKLVTSHIQKRIDGAVKLNNKGKPEDGSKLLFDTSFGKKALYWGLMIPSHIFKFLL